MHKGALASALKCVKRAQQGPLRFTAWQTKKIAEGMKSAVDVLLVQRSGMKGRKLGSLRDLANLLCGCFSMCIDHAMCSKTILSSTRSIYRKIFDDSRDLIIDRHQKNIAALNDPKEEIRVIDSKFERLLEEHNFSEEEKRIDRNHYYDPTVKNKKGLEYSSSDEVFKAKVAGERFGKNVANQSYEGRREYATTVKKVVGPSTAKGVDWVKFGDLAQERLIAKRRPPCSEAGKQSLEQAHTIELEEFDLKCNQRLEVFDSEIAKKDALCDVLHDAIARLGDVISATASPARR